ncbi:MAG: tetratricopeptide repeat protein [Cyclobacteriaceae bacterium]|nr:tetratricopeptide repeat protein [Cyclobacteriaceae bacterium]
MITEQNADNIYNIQGGMHLHQSDEVVALLEKQKQQDLNFLTSIDFLDILRNEYGKQKLIVRKDIVEDVLSKLEHSQQLVLHGPPGIGKTTLVYQLIESKQVVYVSVKDRSSVNVLFYLVNKMRRQSNRDLIELTDIDRAFDYIQAELQDATQYFLVDDCERNPELCKRLIALEKFGSKFLFVSRSKTLFESQAIQFYPCRPFTEDEVKYFLEGYGVSMGIVDFNTVFAASEGNPLYLLYFSRNQISPLPKDIEEFQTQIWSSLAWEQQEILGYVSLGYSYLRLLELSEIIDTSISKVSNGIELLSPLVKNTNGNLEIFHASFEEFVKSMLTSNGLYEAYARRMGAYWLKKEKIVEATYLLIDIDPESLSNYLFEVFRNLIDSGDVVFALKVLTTKLRFAKSNFEKGYANYHLCLVHHWLGNRLASTEAIDKALVFLKDVIEPDEKVIFSSAKMFKAMDLMLYGKVQDALKLADTVFEEIKDRDSKALILVNLSKIYVDLHEFEKGAVACREAYQLFEKEGNMHGMMSSLLNLVTCLAQMPSFLSEAESHGLTLLELIEKRSNFSMQVVVLNSLTSIYRQKSMFEKARSYAMRAVQLCQKHQLKAKVVLNLVNYANVVRDEGKTDESLTIYHEALSYAVEYSLKKEIGRIYWILAGVYTEKGNLDLGIAYADKSIQISTKINFYYGIANAYCEKAEALKRIGKIKEAAQTLEHAAANYGKIHEFRNSRQSRLNEAIDLYRDANENEECIRVLSVWIETAEELQYSNLVKQLLRVDKATIVFELFEKIFKIYFTTQVDHPNLIRQFLLYIDYCEKFKDLGGKAHYQHTLHCITDNIGRAKYSYSILGFAIEQSGNLVGMDELLDYSARLESKLSFFSLRHVNEELIILCSVEPGLNLEIHVFDDEPVCLKLALALVLLLHEEPKLVLDDAKTIKALHCPIWIHWYSDKYAEVMKGVVPPESELYDEETQSVHMDKANYEIQEMILIGRQYEKYSNLNAYPDNKTSFHFFTRSVMGIKGHLYQKDVLSVMAERKKIYNYAAKVFDYVDIDQEEPVTSAFGPDISKLKDKLFDK